MKLATRLFFWGSVLLTVTGVAHFIGQYASPDPGSAGVRSMMKAYHPEGASFSQLDVQETFGACFGFSLIWAGASGLLFGKILASSHQMIRTASLFYAIAPAGMSAIAAAYGILPPVIVFTPSLILYLAAFFAAPRHA